MVAERIFCNPSAAAGVRRAMEAWLAEGNGRLLLLEIAREIEDDGRGRTWGRSPAALRDGASAAPEMPWPSAGGGRRGVPMRTLHRR